MCEECLNSDLVAINAAIRAGDKVVPPVGLTIQFHRSGTICEVWRSWSSRNNCYIIGAPEVPGRPNVRCIGWDWDIIEIPTKTICFHKWRRVDGRHWSRV